MYIKSQSVGIARRLLQGPVWLEEALIREDASRKAAPPGALDTCRAAYSEFLPSIHEDLLPYAGGITKQMMNQTLVNESFYNGFAGEAGQRAGWLAPPCLLHYSSCCHKGRLLHPGRPAQHCSAPPAVVLSAT